MKKKKKSVHSKKASPKKGLARSHKSAIVIAACIIAVIAITASLILFLPKGNNENTGPFTTILNENGTVIISGLADKSIINNGLLEIPEKIDGIPVTEIGNAAFYSVIEIEEVSIPESVTTIHSNAFEGCTSLKSITIPTGVTKIDNYTFQGCTSLESIDLSGTNVLSIGDFAFYKCQSLVSLSLPEGLVSIGNHTFAKCLSLSSFIAPATLETIDKYAFLGCEGLNNDCGGVILSASIKKIGEFAFNGVKKEYFSAPDGSYAASYVAGLSS